jgi:hypothetical protein
MDSLSRLLLLFFFSIPSEKGSCQKSFTKSLENYEKYMEEGTTKATESLLENLNTVYKFKWLENDLAHLEQFDRQFSYLQSLEFKNKR